MENKPLHYDGSLQIDLADVQAAANESLHMTDEVRRNLGWNPYSTDSAE